MIQKKKVRKILERQKEKKKQIDYKKETGDQIELVSKLNAGMSWKWHTLALVLIIVTGITAYTNSIDGSFHYDDKHSIVENSSIRSLNPVSIWRGNNQSRFVGFYSFALNYHFGGTNEVRRWHYLNISLHILCALLLYGFLSLLIQDIHLRPRSKIPLMAAVLFAVHPICSEPVNYIQARHVLFYSLFSLSGVICTILFLSAMSRTRRIVSVIGIAASVVLGGMSKDIGIYYVVLTIGLYLLIFRWRWAKGKRIFPLVVSAAAIAAIVICIAVNLERYFSMLFQGGRHPIMGRVSYVAYLLTEAQVFWRYIWLLVPFSSSLSVDHCVRVVKTQTVLHALIAPIPFLCIGAVMIVGFKQRLKKPVSSFLVLWSVFGLLPYVLVQRSAEFMVEYRMYLPAMGFLGLAAFGLERAVMFIARRLSLRNTFPVMAAVVGLLMIVCVKETRARNRVWLNEYTLWKDAVEKSPGEARVHYRLGNVYRDMGKTGDAIASYEKAIEINPGYAEMHNNLANAYYSAGRTEKAIASYMKALEIDPEHASAHHNLGLAYKAAGQTRDAITSYKKAIEINPGYAKAYINLGVAYNSIGKKQEAIDSYKKAIEINPNYVEAYNNLANVYYSSGKVEDAITLYRKVLEINPNHAVTHYNLGLAYKSIGKGQEAIASFRKAVENNPRFSPALGQ
ncbi:MAG: tetratricopeptide repeat protein [Candidatus Omnitrophota bacterium]